MIRHLAAADEAIVHGFATKVVAATIADLVLIGLAIACLYTGDASWKKNPLRALLLVGIILTCVTAGVLFDGVELRGLTRNIVAAAAAVLVIAGIYIACLYWDGRPWQRYETLVLILVIIFAIITALSTVAFGPVAIGAILVVVICLSFCAMICGQKF